MQSRQGLPLSPSAERNKEPILEVLRRHLPARGKVLEIASGTGQHILHFANALPGIVWQPSERSPDECAAIRARTQLALHGNALTPAIVDVQGDPWPMDPIYDALICINMIHIAPWSATQALFRGAQQVLRAAGARLIFTYGPYKEGGRHGAASNEEFDRSLRARDPAWGVRDLRDVDAAAASRGFARRELVRMPANNLTLVYAG